MALLFKEIDLYFGVKLIAVPRLTTLFGTGWSKLIFSRMGCRPCVMARVSVKSGLAAVKKSYFTICIQTYVYTDPRILRSPVQTDKYGLTLKVVLKWRDICIENITAVFLDGHS